MDMADAAVGLIFTDFRMAGLMLGGVLLLFAIIGLVAFPASRRAKLLFLLAVANEIRGIAVVCGIGWSFLH